MLDQYRDAPRDPATLRMRREALVDQLGWLADEAKALEPLLADLPSWAVDQAPMPGDRTAKEVLALLAGLDREAYPKWLQQIVIEENPALTPADVEISSDANSRDLSSLLADVQQARAAFISTVQAVPEAEWTRKALLDDKEVDVFAIVLKIVRHDADCLRDLAYRLHEARLSDRA